MLRIPMRGYELTAAGGRIASAIALRIPMRGYEGKNYARDMMTEWRYESPCGVMS